uniref:Uncharacterized protein n=1 Tax=Meloidogyne hapla TaxID=6305 RepID=A0A1I8BIF6_MELHA
MFSFVEYFLNSLWCYWTKNGLVDDGDIELLEDHFEDGVHLKKFHWYFLELSSIGLFGLQPSNRRDSSSTNLHLLPFRQSRLNYLKCLRNFTKTYHSASQSVCSTKEDVNKLFVHFIGPEMHSLLYGEYDDVSDEQTFLSITALKSLWQCMFLVRSEFLRLFLIITHQNILLCQPFEFSKNLIILFKTFWQTFNYFDNLDLLNQRKGLIFKTKEGKNLNQKIGKWKSLSDFAICRAQLEFILERFDKNSSEENEQLTEQFASDIISNLQLIINLLKERVEKNSKENDKNINKLENKIEEALNEQEILTLSCETKSEDEEDFQIFELDPKFTTTDSEGFESEDQNIEQFSTNSLPFGSHKAITNELKNVLSERKEFCLKREMQALAKSRGVLPEEIEREELDRKPFNFCKLTKEQKIVQPISRGVFGSTMDTNCLNEILEKRQAIFGEKSEYMKMEEYGHENEEDEKKID